MKLKLSQLKLNPGNPRVIKDDKFAKLVKSIQEFPEMLSIRPIVIDEKNTVLGGNMRVKALQELGYKEVSVVVFKGLTEDQKKEFIIKDNMGYGEWDWNMLIYDWDCDKLEGWGLDIPYLQNDEEGENDVPEKGPRITLIGDLWELNNHRLLCGSSCIVSDVEKLMNGKNADLIFTDPPYDLEDTYTGIILGTAEDGCHVFIMGSDKKTVKRASDFAEYFRYMFVVDIRHARLISNKQPMTRHALIAFFLKGKGRFNNLRDGFTTLIESATVHKMIDGFNQHKRVELPETFILHYSKPNELVCDFFCGAGSTLIASEKNNRNAYLMEIEPEHCDITIKRWINYMKEHSKLLQVRRNGKVFNPKLFA